MSCHQAQTQLHAHADKELTGQQLSMMNEHLAECPECAAELRQIHLLKAQVRAAVTAQPTPLGLETRVRTGLTQKRSPGWSPLMNFAVAGVGAVVLGASLWMTVWRPMELQVLALLGIGASDHVHCTLERKNPPPGQLNRPIDPEYGDLLARVKSAMPSQYELLESHYCRWQNRRFQHIVFNRGGHRISLILTPKKDGADSFPRLALQAKMKQQGIPIYQARIGDLESAGFESGRNLAFVVSDQDQEEIGMLLAALAPVIRDRM